VVGNLKSNPPEVKDRLTTPEVDLKLVMDQSVHVESDIYSVTIEGVLGAVLCSLVRLVFLGEWRIRHCGEDQPGCNSRGGCLYVGDWANHQSDNLVPGFGALMFIPLFLIVAYAVRIAYFVSVTFVPTRRAGWLSVCHPKSTRCHCWGKIV
jgi:multidrug efflux pump subunit AcrB